MSEYQNFANKISVKSKEHKISIEYRLYIIYAHKYFFKIRLPSICNFSIDLLVQETES